MRGPPPRDARRTRPAPARRRSRWGLAALTCAAVVACGGAAPRPADPPLPAPAYANYLAGRLAVHRGDWAAAAAQLAAAAAAAPDQAVVAVELARAQQRARAPGAAQATLAAARARWPTHPEVWRASGDLLAADAPAEARAAYRRAIELEPTSERAYLGLAKLEDPRASLGTLRRLVAKVPTSVEGRYRLAQRLAAARDLRGAGRELQAVLELDPDHIDARLDLARALRVQGRLVEAIAHTRSAFDRVGQEPDVAEELFWVLCEADDLTAAVDLLELLEDDGASADALALAARLHRGLGRLEAARRAARRLRQRDPGLSALALAEIELAAGDPAGAARRALALARAVEGASPTADGGAAPASGDAAPPLGPGASAVGAAGAAPAAAGQAAAPGADAGRAVDGAVDDPVAAGGPRARAAREVALAARRLAAAALLELGDAPRALEAIGPALARAPARADVVLAAGLALVDAGRLAEARALGGALAPRAAAVVRAQIAERAGDGRGALALVEPLARRGDVPAALDLAGSLIADDPAAPPARLADAARYLRRARELAPGDPGVLASWGRLARARGDARGAVAALARAARLAPREPEIQLELAAAWLAAGDRAAAAAALGRAAALHPGPRVQRKLAAARARL